MLGTYALSAGYYDAYYGKALKVRRLIADDFDRGLPARRRAAHADVAERRVPVRREGRQPAGDVPVRHLHDPGQPVRPPGDERAVRHRRRRPAGRRAGARRDARRAADVPGRGRAGTGDDEDVDEPSSDDATVCLGDWRARRRPRGARRAGDGDEAVLGAARTASATSRTPTSTRSRSACPARCRCSTGRPSSWRCASAWPSTARSSRARSTARTTSIPTCPRRTRSASTTSRSTSTAGSTCPTARGSASSGRTSRRTPASRRTSAAPAGASTAATTR